MSVELEKQNKHLKGWVIGLSIALILSIITCGFKEKIMIAIRKKKGGDDHHDSK